MDAIETLEYRGHIINIYQDIINENPWQDWDCEPPIKYKAGRNSRDYGVSNAIREKLERFKPMNNEELAKLAGVSGITLEQAQQEADEYGLTMTAILIDEIEDSWDDDDLARLAEIARVIGMPSKIGEICCYNVGVSVDYLIVLTPDWYALTGCRIDQDKSNLDGAARLFGHWVNGEIYGYRVDGPLCDDSCWGFFGEPEKSGLMDTARGSIDYAIQADQWKHQRQVKQWIKNKVPFGYRTPATA